MERSHFANFIFFLFFRHLLKVLVAHVAVVEGGHPLCWQIFMQRVTKTDVSNRTFCHYPVCAWDLDADINYYVLKMC